MPRPYSLAAAVFTFAACHAAAQTTEPAPDTTVAHQTVTIQGHYDNAVGTSDAAPQGVIRRDLLKSRPALRPGEVLEFVPGVIVTQHSGDGKANQYFLRGFNPDLALGIHAENSLAGNDWMRTAVGPRAHGFRFDVDSATPTESGRLSDTQISPKLSVAFGAWRETELSLNAVLGPHSNDARGSAASVDPVPGLVPSKGWEIGVRTEALSGVQSSLALWELRNASELVYLGDTQTTEPDRASRRRGIEWNNRWMPQQYLLVDADFALSRARFRNPGPAGDRIPAVERVASVAVALRDLGPWSGSLQWRYLGSRPPVEDNSGNSVRVPSTLLTNLRVGYKIGSRADLTLDVFNLFDRKVNDIDYFHKWQLPGESAQVSDRHLQPAEPRTLRATLQVRF